MDFKQKIEIAYAIVEALDSMNKNNGLPKDGDEFDPISFNDYVLQYLNEYSTANEADVLEVLNISLVDLMHEAVKH